jgi:hypothetical protein
MHSLKSCEQQAGPARAVGVVGSVGAVGAVGTAMGAVGTLGAIGVVRDVGMVGGSTTCFIGDNVTGAEVGRGETVGVASRTVTAGGR